MDGTAGRPISQRRHSPARAARLGHFTRRRALVVALVGAALISATATMAEAQGGRGRGQGRAAPAPSEHLAPGEYSLEFERMLEAVNRGEGRQALVYYERVAVEAERGGDPRRAGQAWVAVSLVATRLGLFQKGIQSGRHGIELLKPIEPVSNPLLFMIANAYASVGQTYRHVGDPTEARKIFEEGLAYVETRRNLPAAGFTAGYLGRWLSYVDFYQGDYQSALMRASASFQFFKDGAAALGSRVPDKVRWDWYRQAAMSAVAVGRAQRALGRLDMADAAFHEALQYARIIGLRELEVDILLEQGNLALARQEWSKAAEVFQRGLPLARQIGSLQSLVWLNGNLARALDGLGRTDDALAAARDAMQYVEQTRGELGESGLRSGFLDDKQDIYQLGARLALKAQHPDEAFAFAERSRARAFLDLLGSQTTLSKGKTRAMVDEEVRLRVRLAEARALTQETEGAGDLTAARATLAAANQDYRAFLERVRKESAEQASLMTVEPVTLPEIQRLLPEGTTLLEYLAGKDDTILWVIDRQTANVVQVPGDYQSLIGQVRSLRDAIANQAPLADVEAQATVLYRRLFEPARREIHGERLLIVPHGVLHYLPFSALRSPAGKWVVEEFALSTLPSASVLRYLTDKAAAASGRALVVGNPDLGAGLALQWAEREARMVGQETRDATVLVKGDATEAQIKKLVEGVGLIHFATHGELSESDPLSSALLLVPGGGQDGRLEVREVFGLDLHAQLVVLSACETGLGKLSRGDELLGLQRAFLYAGTPAVVTTLWKVDDRASYELMRVFYDRLKGVGPLGALRQAQMETMRTFPHPFAWAAFGLAGVQP